MAESAIDPFDLAGLEKSLNDSSTRVSAIWLSFVAFSAYLAAAVSNVSHRQLFLEEAIKLPTINIDLSLFASALVLPTLYVIFHVYVLLQVLLLSRTASAYNSVVERAGLRHADDNYLRQRLANTLFAQIFAGSPRERSGWLGAMLKSIVWTTLAVGPILILLLFQFMFLPYHSHVATWAHRLLILVEVIAFFSLWPLALDGRKEIEWIRIRKTLRRIATLPLELFRARARWRYRWLLLRRHLALLASCLLFVAVALLLVSFPGEPHINLLTAKPLYSVNCDRWFAETFDRLNLRQIDVVDDDKLKRIEATMAITDEPLSQGERTRNFRGRDLNCADFSGYADLRRVDLSDAQLRGADLSRAKLQGASLKMANLQGASLSAARLQGVDAEGAQLQGANLFAARLRGALLDSAQLQGASLGGTRLEGASLAGAQLQGALLFRTRLQGAYLPGAQLQGASIHYAQLQGAYLDGAQLQGADLEGANLDNSLISNTYVWFAKNANCEAARVVKPKSEAKLPGRYGDDPTPLGPDRLVEFIEYSVAGIPDKGTRKRTSDRMRGDFFADPKTDEALTIAKVWNLCEKNDASSISLKQFEEKRAKTLRDIACDSEEDRKIIADGIAERLRNYDAAFSTTFARGLLGRDGRECVATGDLDQKTKEKLLSFLPRAERLPGPRPLPLDE